MYLYIYIYIYIYASSCNTPNELSSMNYKACFPNKTKDLYLSVFNMITGINRLKISTTKINHTNLNGDLIEKTSFGSMVE